MARSAGVKENGHAASPVTRANGSAQKAVKDQFEDDFEEENIFIFIPNIIGAQSTPSAVLPTESIS
jgi:hypothetical protein